MLLSAIPNNNNCVLAIFEQYISQYKEPRNYGI